MKPAGNRGAPGSAAQDLLRRQKRLLEEIDRYLEYHGDLSRLSRKGLRQLGSILVERIREFEPVKKV